MPETTHASRSVRDSSVSGFQCRLNNWILISSFANIHYLWLQFIRNDRLRSTFDWVPWQQARTAKSIACEFMGIYVSAVPRIKIGPVYTQLANQCSWSIDNWEYVMNWMATVKSCILILSERFSSAKNGSTGTNTYRPYRWYNCSWSLRTLSICIRRLKVNASALLNK